MPTSCFLSMLFVVSMLKESSLSNSEAVDAFTVHWNGDINWLCLPVSLVTRVIGHLKACKCEGTLLVPAWQSAPYWPLLFPYGTYQASWICEALMFPWSEDLIVSGRSGAKLPATGVLAVRVSGKD